MSFKKQRVSVGDQVTHIMDTKLRGNVVGEDFDDKGKLKSNLVQADLNDGLGPKFFSRDELLTRQDVEDRRNKRIERDMDNEES